jgi:hypothetical protein
MPIQLELCDGLIEAACHAKVTAEHLEHIRTILRDFEARLEVTPNRISDLTGADLSDLSSEDLVVFAEYRRAATLKNKIKSAIVAAKGSSQYGLARMFMAHNSHPDIELKIFYDPASAYQWLGREAKEVGKPKA